MSHTLRLCPNLTILATSRERFNVYGEALHRVRNLPIPDTSTRPVIAIISEVAAIKLFLERAKSILEDFAITKDNAADVIAICRHLDGIPLAIELAAVRVKALTPTGDSIQTSDEHSSPIRREPRCNAASADNGCGDFVEL